MSARSALRTGEQRALGGERAVRIGYDVVRVPVEEHLAGRRTESNAVDLRSDQQDEGKPRKKVGMDQLARCAAHLSAGIACDAVLAARHWHIKETRSSQVAATITFSTHQHLPHMTYNERAAEYNRGVLTTRLAWPTSNRRLFRKMQVVLTHHNSNLIYFAATSACQN